MKRQDITQAPVEHIDKYETERSTKWVSVALEHCRGFGSFADTHNPNSTPVIDEALTEDFRERCYGVVKEACAKPASLKDSSSSNAISNTLMAEHRDALSSPSRISSTIAYLLAANNWTEKILGENLADAAQNLASVAQYRISRWKQGLEKPTRNRIEQLHQLCYQTVLNLWRIPNGLNYICNLSDHYGDRYSDRADEALARVREAVIRECPPAPVGDLSIVVFKSALPAGVRAQCFSSEGNPPRCFVILVNDDPDWIASARFEILAHVLPSTLNGVMQIRED